jgi:hypothetical protein
MSLNKNLQFVFVLSYSARIYIQLCVVSNVIYQSSGLAIPRLPIIVPTTSFTRSHAIVNGVRASLFNPFVNLLANKTLES